MERCSTIWFTLGLYYWYGKQIWVGYFLTTHRASMYYPRVTQDILYFSIELVAKDEKS